MGNTPSPSYDTLTGALARSEMAGCIQSALDLAQLKDQCFALVMLDLDEFKSINDAFGHTRGDQVLVEVVRRILNAVRTCDQVFRYGGDEFILLLANSTREQALQVAGRVRDALLQQPVMGSPPVSLSASLGLAVYPDDAATPEELFEVIDRRMLLGKSRGRGVLVADVLDDDPDGSQEWVHLPGRLIEREPAMQQVRGFLGQLAQLERGLLLVSGPPGSGRTRLVEETARIARLQGYAIWMGRGSPAYAARRTGLLAEMQQFAGWRRIYTRSGELAAALNTWLHDVRRTGLLICLDDLAWIDPATLECLLSLLEQPGLDLPVGLVCSGSLLPAIQSAGQTVALFVRVELTPLNEHSVQVWLRHGLHWEAPVEFTRWLWQQSGGLPGLLANGLEWLVQQGLLRSEYGQWRISRALLPENLAVVLEGRPGLAHNLPPRLPPFFGREDIIWQVKNLLYSVPMVTLRAPDGAGKTRLAMQVVAELRDAGVSDNLGPARQAGKRDHHFPDGVFRALYVPGLLPERLPFLLAEVFQVRGLGQEDPVAGLAAALLGKRLLLVLDDLNPPVEIAHQVASLLERLLQQVPGLRLLATARQATGLPGETCLDLDGLSYPAEFALPDDYPAGQFFLHEALQAQPAFQPSVEDATAILRICRQVEGMPLGLELAAAWLSSFSCAQIANEINNNLGFLMAAPNGQERPGLMAVLDSFWLLFSPAEQAVLASLSVFESGFTGQAAARVAYASSFFLDALAVKHFLHLAPARRYTMHPLLGRYVLARLNIDPLRTAEVRRRHARYYLDFIQAAHREKTGAGRWDLPQLRPELPNLRAAWLEAVSAHHMDELADAFQPFFGLLGSLSQFNEAIELAQAAVDTLKDGWDERDTLLKARLLARQGEFCYHAGEYLRGEAALNQALVLLASLFSDQAPVASAPPGENMPAGLRETAIEQAESLRLLATLKQARGEYAEALLLLEQAREVAEPLGLPGLLFNIHNRAGTVAFMQGDTLLAANYYENALAQARQAAEPGKVATALNNLGEVAVLAGEYDKARALLLESLSLTQPNTARTLYSAVLETLGLLERESGRLRAAAIYFSRALRATLDIDAIPLVLEIFGNIAELWARLAGEDDSYTPRAADLARLVMTHPAAQHAIRRQAAGLAGRLAEVPPAHPEWTHQHLRRVIVDVLEILC